MFRPLPGVTPPAPRPIGAATAIALALLALLFLSSCSAVQSRLALRDCRFDLRNVALKSLDLRGANLGVALGIVNPNSVEAVLDALEFDLYLDGDRLGRARTDQRLAVAPGGSDVISVDFHADYAGLAGQALRALQSGRPKAWRVDGSAMVRTPIGDLPVPVDVSGTF